MNDWIKKNGLQLILLAAGALLAWGAINARVSAIEAKVNRFPSADYFQLKFDTLEKKVEQNSILIKEQNKILLELEK